MNQLISVIRTQSDKYVPIGLALLAFIIYVAHVHIRGYPGDANLYYDAARYGDWFVRPLHFGYVAILNLSFVTLGPLVPNLYLVQGVLSAIAGAVSVWLVIHITRSLSFENHTGTGLIAGAFFAFSGGILITANYGETYMLQTAFILGATASVLKRRFLVAGVLLGWSISFTPLSILLMPVVLVAVGLLVLNGRLSLKNLVIASLGALGALLFAVSLVSVYDANEIPNWFDALRNTVSGYEGRGRARFDFVLVQLLWLGRGLHIATPLILTGTAVVIANRSKPGLLILLAAILTLIINLPVMVRTDDYWRMMMIVNIYGAILAAIGLAFIVGRLGMTGSKGVAASVIVLTTFVAISLIDMPQREKAVANETHQIYKEILEIERPALVVSVWENIISTPHYAEVDGITELPELVSFPPLLNWIPPPDVTQMVDDAIANEKPVYVIIRERRFDSPLMRAAVGSIDTGYAVEYQSIFTRFTLQKIGPLGDYHALYFADPN